jgi:hypothetical protein
MSDDKLIDAELHDDLTLDAFFEAEEAWAGERVRVLHECVKRNVPASDIPQSVHWNWALKTLKLRALSLGPLSPHRLFGIKAESHWQGLLLGCCLGYASRLHSERRDIAYVDYVETAPWNWNVKTIGRTPLYRGCGLQLFETAVRWSDDLGFKGRVGLHSLPQSEEFYSNRCHMTDLGPDTKYKPPMRYFEIGEKAANEHFLMEN